MKACLRKLFSRPAWTIARAYGCEYSGDLSPVPHGGFFYDSRDWKEHGYANAVRFFLCEDSNRMIVERCTINKPLDMVPAFECCDVQMSDRDLVDAQIEACEGYMGAETDEIKEFAPDANDNLDEDKILNSVKGWIRALGK
jgi:hypothetical protein